jgi:hypothetical protein
VPAQIDMPLNEQDDEHDERSNERFLHRAQLKSLRSKRSSAKNRDQMLNESNRQAHSGRVTSSLSS